jgi:hypothetical protein
VTSTGLLLIGGGQPADPREAARQLLPEWQRRLRLGDWYIAVSDLDPESDARSNVDMHTQIRQAAIRLDKKTPASQVERQLVHELLHVRFAYTEWALQLAKKHTPLAFDESNDALWNSGMEAGIEALCDALGCAPRSEWESSLAAYVAAFPTKEATNEHP